MELPEGFPRELEPHLEAVYTVLSDLAARHGAKAVSRLSLASVLIPRSRKPLVMGAHDYRSWADGQPQRRKDVVAGYRNWVDKAPDLAAVERLSSNGRAEPTPSQREPVKLANSYQRFYEEAS